MTENLKTNRPIRIFLSYASADRSYASRVQTILSKRPNVRIFTTETLSAGEDWQLKLKNELSNSDIFIVILSPNSVASKWVLHELGAAWGTDKIIIPIVTNPDIVNKLPVSLKAYLNINDLEQPETVDKIFDHYGDSLSLN